MKRILKIQYTLYVFFCIENALSNGYCTELNALLFMGLPAKPAAWNFGDV